MLSLFKLDGQANSSFILFLHFNFIGKNNIEKQTNMARL